MKLSELKIDEMTIDSHLDIPDLTNEQIEYFTEYFTEYFKDAEYVTGYDLDDTSAYKILITKDPGWLHRTAFHELFLEPVGEALPRIKDRLVAHLNYNKE